MSEQVELTTSEKIDYIYNYIKNEERKNKVKTIIKWFFRLFIIAYIFYVYLYLWPIARDFYSTIFPNIGTTQTQDNTLSNSGETNGEVQIGTFKISKEKVDQIKTLFCK